MTITDVVNKFNTTPFLFIGSGMSRRYLNLPDWKGLLNVFAQKINDDMFAYRAYESRAQSMSCTSGVMPKIAELIQLDFDEKWFADPTLRTLDKDGLEKVAKGVSPFKAEVAEYIKQMSVISTDMQEEIDKLREISHKSLSGVITTNYDSFLEDLFTGYKKYTGQAQLIFSPIQGVAEIYKIHGSVENPETLVINEEDYTNFADNCAYLAAKLMTIFVEYPIIFMGYSISDTNIMAIMKAIVACLTEEQVETLSERFVFVEYQPGKTGVDVTPATVMLDGKPLKMTQITLSDFLPLYTALGYKKATLPVRLLRTLKEELYSYIITNETTSKMRVASIDDARIGDEDMVLAIGRADQLGLRGLSGINGNEWYRNIVLNDLDFSADELLTHAFESLKRQNSGSLPVHKYLANAKRSYAEIEAYARTQTMDTIISKSFRKYRGPLGEYTSVKQIWEHEKPARAAYLTAYLTEDQIAVDELEAALVNAFANARNLLDAASPSERTYYRRVIKIYDYLKWAKK